MIIRKQKFNTIIGTVNQKTIFLTSASTIMKFIVSSEQYLGKLSGKFGGSIGPLFSLVKIMLIASS